MFIECTMCESHQRLFCSVCPTASMENQNFLCLDVTASVVIITNDGQTIVNEDFTSSLNGAVEEGRLQEFLTEVNSNLQLILYKG